MIAWLDRRFGYEPPSGEFPMIVERLRGAPARVNALLRWKPPALLTRRDGDAWSAQEHVGHLLDLEPLWARRVEEFMTGVTTLTAADMTNRRTREARHNDRSLASLTAEFSVARSRLVSRLDAATDDDVVRTSLHPRLQRTMRLVDLCFFVAEHDDHHLAIVTRLLRPAAVR
jgi:uncharacterized damage-inducible protein DinB